MRMYIKSVIDLTFRSYMDGGAINPRRDALYKTHLRVK